MVLSMQGPVVKKVCIRKNAIRFITLIRGL